MPKTDLFRLVVLQKDVVVHRFDPESKADAEARKTRELEFERTAQEEARMDGQPFEPAEYRIWEM